MKDEKNSAVILLHPPKKQESEDKGKQEFLAEFLELRVKGHSFRYIAKKLGKSTSTICEWNKKYQSEIENYKNEYIKQAMDTFMYNEFKNIEQNQEILRKLQGEANRINFSNLSPEKILNFVNKYSNRVEKGVKNIAECIHKTHGDPDEMEKYRKEIKRITERLVFVKEQRLSMDQLKDTPVDPSTLIQGEPYITKK
ncbi:MAG: helix-turn-helix domain-containing protein [Candidatus Cloacimonetes bacterium]|nr:helix-turn-helix domain-containing protein [Candidatus Cloacimonadota bacterium]